MKRITADWSGWDSPWLVQGLKKLGMSKNKVVDVQPHVGVDVPEGWTR